MESELGKKWWYRLLQVVFWVCFVGVGIFIGVVLYAERPNISYYDSTYKVECNGISEPFGKFTYNDISIVTYNPPVFSFEKSTLFDPITKGMCAEIIKQGKMISMEERNDFIDKMGVSNWLLSSNDLDTNYKIILGEKVYSPSWNDFDWYIVWVVTIFLAVFTGIMEGFHYIVTGKTKIKWRTFIGR